MNNYIINKMPNTQQGYLVQSTNEIHNKEIQESSKVLQRLLFLFFGLILIDGL